MIVSDWPPTTTCIPLFQMSMRADVLTFLRELHTHLSLPVRANNRQPTNYARVLDKFYATFAISHDWNEIRNRWSNVSEDFRRDSAIAYAPISKSLGPATVTSLEIHCTLALFPTRINAVHRIIADIGI
ncbi:hypothetical protein [Sphingorhabdus lutea]|uniref:hypothetical protein n=1 Tax=Sphingorhabdus lutea TaxID=1913578 RepID=UPI0012EC9116|nr:hypothetical protein [Sphingorhabdus lutea]